MKKIGLLMVGLLVLGQAEFKRGDNNLTVIDTDTQLEWQDSYKDNDIIRTNWGSAVNYCEELKLDEKNDWRLPNINELKSIIVETQYAPTIDEKFKRTTNHLYFSSTTKKRNSNVVFIVNFDIGSLGYDYKTSTYGYFVRCVRDAD